MAASKTDGKKKVVKKIAKQKAKGSAAAEKAPAAAAPKEKKEEKKVEKKVEKKEEKKKAPAKAAAAASASKAPAKGKDKPAKADAEEEAKAQPKAQSRKTKARRLEEAQARVDAEETGKGKRSAAAAASDEPRGVVYVSHIPQGFFEPQMKKYFSQFGKVLRVRHSRSKKNAASKGYGWVEFEEEAVAQIAQQTMDGYLMFGKKLKCEMVPQEKLHPALFKNANKRMVNYTKLRRRKAREVYNNRPSAEVEGETIPRMTLRQAARRTKGQKRLSSILKGMEVKYDLDAAQTDTGEGDIITLTGSAGPRGKKRAQETPSSPKTTPASPKTAPSSPKTKAKAKAKAAAASGSSEAKAAKKRKNA